MKTEYVAVEKRLLDLIAAEINLNPGLRNRVCELLAKDEGDGSHEPKEVYALRLLEASDAVVAELNTLNNIRKEAGATQTDFDLRCAVGQVHDLIHLAKRMSAACDSDRPETAGPFVVGNWYQTKQGGWIKVMGVSNPKTDHETIFDQYGFHRYTRLGVDCGRCTGSKPSDNDLRPPVLGWNDSCRAYRAEDITSPVVPSVVQYRINKRDQLPVKCTPAELKDMRSGGCMEDTYDEGSLREFYTPNDVAELIHDSELLALIMRNVAAETNSKGLTQFFFNANGDLSAPYNALRGSVAAHFKKVIDHALFMQMSTVQMENQS